MVFENESNIALDRAAHPFVSALLPPNGDQPFFLSAFLQIIFMFVNYFETSRQGIIHPIFRFKQTKSRTSLTCRPWIQLALGGETPKSPSGRGRNYLPWFLVLFSVDLVLALRRFVGHHVFSRDLGLREEVPDALVHSAGVAGVVLVLYRTPASRALEYGPGYRPRLGFPGS